MYVNLVLGVLVLAAVIWLLVIYNRKGESPKDMLADEISKRRAAQDTAKKAQEELARLRREHLAMVERGLEEMRQGLAEQGLRADLMHWRVGDDSIVLRVGAPEGRSGGTEADANNDDANNGDTEHQTDIARVEQFIIRWNVRSVDMDFLNSSEPLYGLRGDFIMIWPDGSMTLGSDLREFLRAISSVIADRLA